jgi:mannose-1-phosphate guanylyltransferase/mannose-6-phosphate isomerase
MIPLVLSGGAGTRLWPVSRASFPKQFAALFDEALLTKTLRRLGRFGVPGVIAVAESEVLTRGVLAELGFADTWAIFEPLGRNTAPAVALACHLAQQRGAGDEILGIFPADHLITDETAFDRVLALAVQCAERGEVVTLGILPTRPETGYGYLEVTPKVFAEGGGAIAHLATSFREKPDAPTAEEYLRRRTFLWNAGMFVFRAAVMAGHFATHMPMLWREIQGLRADLGNLDEIYRGLPSESLDYGIMEKLDRVVVIPSEIGWSDVGSWDEVARLHGTEPDPAVVEVDARNNFVHPHGRRVYGLVGVEDLLVVDSADALLVARRGRSQEVKQVVDRLRDAGRKEATEHVFEHRPWGDFEVLRDTDRFKSKVIRVRPGRQLSYQSHRHRAEHWVIVSGRPEVVLEDVVHPLGPGDHLFIPRGAKHRIRNPTAELVEFVEVQLGDYFGEDDIVRYEDDYRRS